MSAKKASDYFHGEEGYNCSQAVLKACQQEHDVSQEMIDTYSAYGGGRAEEGLCGALYAAKSLLNDPEKTELLKNIFLKKAGGITCEKILELKKLPCPDCVDLAAQIMDET
jgi:hypothetical protein